MSPKAPLQLPAALRGRLLDALGERAWPPPARDEWDELFAATAARILRELADEPPPGLPDCADWVLLVPDERAPALRSEPLDSRVLVAGVGQWEELGEDARRDVSRAAALLRLELAGRSPADWSHLLPDSAPDAATLEATLGPQAPALWARLTAPGFGLLEILHVWSLGPDGRIHASEVSGVLRILPES